MHNLTLLSLSPRSNNHCLKQLHLSKSMVYDSNVKTNRTNPPHTHTYVYILQYMIYTCNTRARTFIYVQVYIHSHTNMYIRSITNTYIIHVYVQRIHMHKDIYVQMTASMSSEIQSSWLLYIQRIHKHIQTVFVVHGFWLCM